MQNETIIQTPADKNEFVAASVFETHRPNPWKLAFADLKGSLLNWRIWTMLAYQDIKLRYRRSALGPFWLTLSMAITAYSMGFLYSHLFHQNLQQYFPFIVSGMLTWSLISFLISDLTEGFIVSENLIKQIKLPYTLYIHRVVWRNIIIFLHNFVVYIPIILIFHHVAKINLNSLLILPGIFLIYLNAFFYGILLAIICTRYRDVGQIIKSLLQVIFFLTPIMWSPTLLPKWFVFLNPFYSYTELIRAPLMGMQIPPMSLLVVFIVTLIGILLSMSLFLKYRARIIYWL